jgi:hypothetical protein
MIRNGLDMQSIDRRREKSTVSLTPCTANEESLLVLLLRDVHKDMSQGTCLWTPSPMLDSILGIIIQHLDKVVKFSSTILPVQLADLGIAVEQVQTALAATTATSTDLSNAIGLDSHVVDLILVERLTTISWAVEFTAFNDSVLHCNVTILEMVTNVEGDPLGVVVVQFFHGGRSHCE